MERQTDFRVQQFMLPNKQRTHVTESSVSVPPALVIVDEYGTVFTLGNEPAPYFLNGWEYAFAVVVNGFETPEVACRIERRNGKVRILAKRGWKTWNPIGRYFF